MDILRMHKEMQKKYGLLHPVEGLYLCETYFSECRNYIANNKFKTCVLYGAGGDASELLRLLKHYPIDVDILFVIENNKALTEFHGIPVISECDFKIDFADFVWITSKIYHDEIRNNMMEHFPSVPVFDPYRIIEELLSTTVDKHFHEYSMQNKNKWFEERLKKRKSAKTSEEVARLSQDLIAGYFAIFDWVDLMPEIDAYINACYDGFEKYQDLRSEVENFISGIKKALSQRKQKDLLIFLVDGLSKFIAEDMPKLAARKKDGFSFEYYVNVYPTTREAIMQIVTGWYPFENETYKFQKVSPDSGSLLQFITNQEIQLKLISAFRYKKEYELVNSYKDKQFENCIVSEVYFRGLNELLKDEDRQIIIMHHFDTIHPPHYSPRSSTLMVNHSHTWDEHVENYENGKMYQDDILDFYMDLLDSCKDIRRIVIGDHGLNLRTEYRIAYAFQKDGNDKGPWDLDMCSPAFIIWGYGRKGTENALLSTAEAPEIIKAVLQNIDWRENVKHTGKAILEYVPGYDEGWLKQMQRGNNMYHAIGAKGIMTKDWIYLSFENGRERLFKIQDKDEIEYDVSSINFEETFGEIKPSFLFPSNILEDDFFATHLKFFPKILNE